MNKSFKRIGFAILSIVLMASLLSCTKSLELDKELSRLEIYESLEIMKSEIYKAASNVQAEQDFFKNKSGEEDYHSLAETFESSFENIEEDFGKVDINVSIYINELKKTFVDTDDYDQLLLIEEEYTKLNALFKDLYKYHYLILENDLVLSLFADEVAQLMTYMADGNITTIDYNTDLENLMSEYEDLLVIDDEEIFDDEFLQNPSKVEETLVSLSLAKVEILNLKTNSEVDETVNGQIYNLFAYIEKSIQAVDSYNKSVNVGLYISDVDMRIDEGCLAYVNEILSDN